MCAKGTLPASRIWDCLVMLAGSRPHSPPPGPDSRGSSEGDPDCNNPSRHRHTGFLILTMSDYWQPLLQEPAIHRIYSQPQLNQLRKPNPHRVTKPYQQDRARRLSDAGFPHTAQPDDSQQIVHFYQHTRLPQRHHILHSQRS